MEIDRVDGRTENQLRPLTFSRNVLNRAHGSARWSQGDTIVLAAVYGPKAGTRKNENPEKASIDVIWKPKTGQMGKEEKECEMILRRTMQSICLLAVNPNTTTSIILQYAGTFVKNSVISKEVPVRSPQNLVIKVTRLSMMMALYPSFRIHFVQIYVNTYLLPCAINAASAALVDAGIPLKHLAVSVSCGLERSGSVLLDPTKLEEKNMQAFTYLVFPSSVLSVLPEATLQAEVEMNESGVITSVNHGVMSVDGYLQCLERGRSASAKMSDFLRRNLQSRVPNDLSKAG